MRAKYAYLLEDADVRRWFDNLTAKNLFGIDLVNVKVTRKNSLEEN